MHRSGAVPERHRGGDGRIENRLHPKRSGCSGQYRFDRKPVEKGKKPEPLLAFPGSALVHFAVSDSEVMMAARLDGPETRFLPSNKGDHGAAGNPLNPNGHRTAY